MPFVLYFMKKKNLPLLAKTGFGKSLIFQLISFILDLTGVVLILMPFKLLQVKQNVIINCIPTKKAIALTGENNQKAIQETITKESYNHVFTSPEIILLKKFKVNILDNPRFASRLLLLAIDKIYLVEEWNKGFRPLYVKIEKICKRIPSRIPILGVSAIFTKSVCLCVLSKTGFRDNYTLM